VQVFHNPGALGVRLPGGHSLTDETAPEKSDRARDHCQSPSRDFHDRHSRRSWLPLAAIFMPDATSFIPNRMSFREAVKVWLQAGSSGSFRPSC
jgi:hypothetical protein